MALINQLARAHRRLVLVGNLDLPLRCVDHFGFGTLRRATINLARAINPFLDITHARTVPLEDRLISFGIGADADVRLGCDGWLSIIGPRADVRGDRTSILGAALSACLGAAVAFHRLLGNDETPRGWFSLWEHGQQSTTQGPAFVGPLSLGRVLQVGGGAVGCALDYWLGFVGLQGNWVICDGDIVTVSNLNRQLLFVAQDAGFPDGAALNKAIGISRRVGEVLKQAPSWYGDDQTIVDAVYDLVLPLANERGVRVALQGRAQTILMHATTTPNWTAISHRHVAGHDDCIVCRLPLENEPAFGCSTAPVGARDRMDASLPFLSGLAGLLLLGDLIRLQAGHLLDRRENFTSVTVKTPRPVVRDLIWECRADCRARMPAVTRIRRTRDLRFAHLDGDIRDEQAAKGPNDFAAGCDCA